MAQQIGTSALLRTWANDGTVVVPADAKIDEGWLRGEQPPHEWMNYIHNVLGQKINHALSRGAADWNSGTEYLAGAIVNHDGDLWLALSTSTNSTPSEANANWARIVDQSKDATINSLNLGRGGGNNPTNTAFGFDALNSNTSGTSNTAIGRDALLSNQGGLENTAVGRSALRENTGGSRNTAIGRICLEGNTTGDNNTSVGFETMRFNTVGNNNTAVGRNALGSNTTGNNNTGIGREALSSNIDGDNNTAVGLFCLSGNTSGSNNVAFGEDASRDSTSGINNTAIGRSALRDANGSENCALGRSALQDCTTGSNNIGIGTSSGRGSSPFTVTTQNNRIVMGNNDHTDAYINVSWTVTSDARDKDEIAPIEPGLEFIEALNPVSYQMKAGGRDGSADGRVRYGFLAQDILEIEGENPVIVDAEEPEKLKLHESHIIPVLVKAVQELSARVAKLEGK